MKNIVAKIKSTYRINSRVVNTREWISDLEDKIVEITSSEYQNQKLILKSKNSISDL